VAIDVIMPQMGADMTEGTLVRWLKQVGDEVKRGEILAEIETDKATVELEAFESGTLKKLVVGEGETVPVGQVIAILADADEAVDREPERKAPTPVASRKQTPAPTAEPARAANGVAPAADRAEPVKAAAASGSAAEGRLRISPVARRIAQETGVDIATVTGTGPDGRILRRDVEAAGRAPKAAASADGGATTELPPAPRQKRSAQDEERKAPAQAAEGAPEPAQANTAPEVEVGEKGDEGTTDRGPGAAEQDAKADESAEEPRPEGAQAPVAAERTPRAIGAAHSGAEPLSRMRQAIARRMAQSKQTAPHYYLTLDVDMTEAMAFRGQLNKAATDEQRVSVNDLVVKACALALERHPKFNAEFSDEGLRMHDEINVCIGIALDEGLIAPAILDCGDKSLGRIAIEAKDLIERAKAGKLRQDEYSAGTFTITNLGAYGVETLIGIINPPQAAILGVGSVMPRPAVRDDAVVVRQLMKVALSADHRVTDGAEGARFIKEIQELLENPVSLAL